VILALKTGMALAVAFLMSASLAEAVDYPTPQEHDWVAHDFRFHTGEVMADLKLHYTTVGDPKGEPVLVLHGTFGSGNTMLNPAFAGTLFGAGQPLDAADYFIILPDAIGTGRSAKPSDGLRTKFPIYDYSDMVQGQYRLLTEALGVHHLRLVMGNSMGGMQTWMWGELHPDMMDALVPMASQPTEMSGRNWMMRRMLVESIKQDPAYRDGNYSTPPPSLRLANVMFGIATSGGTLNYQAAAPTSALADKLVEARLAAPPPEDANDFIYQWQSSYGFDAAPLLESIQGSVLAINSADDERNPPETGTLVQAMAHVKNGRIYLIPASAKTSGHGTTSNAAFYAGQLQEFLNTVPRRER
jgi:homoserine O-acetyltransferase